MKNLSKLYFAKSKKNFVIAKDLKFVEFQYASTSECVCGAGDQWMDTIRMENFFSID